MSASQETNWKNNQYESPNFGSRQNYAPPQNKTDNSIAINIPQIALPKGGGALKGIDEKFQVNPSNGSSVFNLALPFSKSRSNFGPSLMLSYNSGAGNSPFGLGWSCDVLSIQRKTDKKLPEYKDEIESDVFLFSGAEDLVPVESKGNIKTYRPRVEGLFARIERIKSDDGSYYWKVTTKENAVTFFGRSGDSRITDPYDTSKIFKWLPDLSFDNKGNVIEFEYQSEDDLNVPKEVHEKNRLSGLAKFTNKYLKKIRYGNKISTYPTENDPYIPAISSDPEYFFEAVFDYGNHKEIDPLPDDNYDWSCRTDPFSDYKPGFEIRTYRLCRRILFYHNFKELSPSGIVEPTLVRSLNFEYKHFAVSTDFSEADYIISIQQFSFERSGGGGYDSASLPKIEFTYNEITWTTEETIVHNVNIESLINSPVGIGGNYQWTDFYNEGISGIFTEQSDGWYYKENLGDGSFTIAKPVLTKPSLTGLSNGTLQLQDIEANGKKYVTMNGNSLNGYFEQTDEGDWLPFKSFDNYVNIDFRDPNVKLIDLNGDGMADLVVSEENVFTWYESAGTVGYEKAMSEAKSFDEEKGPALVFADHTQSIFLADMSGDGMTDIVRIRNGEVCYWPNLGYGKFGAKVTMHNAPVFAAGHDYNPDYLFLNDMSGTGATDLLYLGNNTFQAWFNLSGNSFSGANEIKYFPSTVQPNNVSVLDFLGNGTGCIVWSSPLPDNSQTPMRYIDLMGGIKPYVINSYKNNFGKVTNVEYKSSTQYYLKDKIDGTPWVTKLPFPVQCVSKVEVKDEITGVRFTNQYSYHHGYYDHLEREFRGFGRVEQTDTEVFDEFVKNGGGNITPEELYQPPVTTKTWFHTGAFLDKDKILSQFATEYFQNTDEYHLPEPVLSDSWTAQEWHEALRACKGMTLRQEIFSYDRSSEEKNPYIAVEHNCNIQMVQPVGENKHAVFLVTESEAITYQYERNPSDPRIAHTMNTKIDQFGNIEESASIVYGRLSGNVSVDEDIYIEFKDAIGEEQMKMRIVYNVNKYTNDVIDDFSYRLRLPYENISYELSTKDLTNGYVTLDKIKTSYDSSADILYEAEINNSTFEKRRIEHVKVLYLNDDTVTALPSGELDSLGLVYESYQLAFTDSLAQNLFDTKVDSAKLNEGGYKHLDATNEWWIRSGYIVYKNPPKDNFYLPDKYIDPLGSETEVYYYSDYNLLINKTEDAIGNASEVVKFDFRILSPGIMKDMNGVTSEVAFDTLGLVVGMCIYGIFGDGDSLTGFNTNLSQSEIDNYFNSPEANAITLLGNATSRFVYDFTRSNVITTAVSSIVREKHLHQLEANEEVKLQLSFEYTDGFGKVVMKKVQAEPGLAKQLDANNDVEEVDTTPDLRWIGNGRTIFNNKGNPVKQFEPFFSVDHKYEDEDKLVQIGVTPVMYYDAVGRLIKTEMPDKTFSNVEFDPWYTKTYDANDTVEESEWYSEKIISADANEKDAAQKSFVHNDTPSTNYLDSLGRNICSIANNRYIDRTTNAEVNEYYPSLITLDIEGNQRSLKDARKNIVMEYKHDMLGKLAYQKSMDAGERWMFNDCMQKPVYKWDSMNTEFRFSYDLLHRPVKVEATETGKPAIVTSIIEYGETIAGNYKKGKVYRTYDSAGIATNDDFDFKGNLRESKRQLCLEYKSMIDWSVIADVVMESGDYKTETEFDALNRPIKIISPDDSVFTPLFNEASLLESLNVKIKGVTNKDFVNGINYNEKGQRTDITYGNGVQTFYKYYDTTFRIKQILTKKSGTETLQDLNYTYDAVGNITRIIDNAQPTNFFNNMVSEPVNDYTYDAIYRLVKASGREQDSTLIFGTTDNYSDTQYRNSFSTGSPLAVRNYTQHYAYDSAGNMTEMNHIANGGSWTRLFETDTSSNRLLKTTVGADVYNYVYNLHGSMTQMPHLPDIDWNIFEQMSHTDLGGGGHAYYVYDASGIRTRKVIERSNAPILERIYLGNFEIYREYYNVNAPVLERETLHVMDDKKRIAMVDTRTIGSDAYEEQLIRYQYSNHLGTATLELDDAANVISYEEYHPFGTTSFQAMSSEIKATAKRYRYTGKERDEETGFNYHGARYYAPWLARWTAADPIGVGDGWNIFIYVHNNPIRSVDSCGYADDGNSGIYMGTEELNGMIVARFMAVEGTWVSASAKSIGLDAEFPREDAYGAYMLNGRFFRNDGTEMDYPDVLDVGEEYLIAVGSLNQAQAPYLPVKYPPPLPPMQPPIAIPAPDINWPSLPSIPNLPEMPKLPGIDQFKDIGKWGARQAIDKIIPWDADKVELGISLKGGAEGMKGGGFEALIGGTGSLTVMTNPLSSDFLKLQFGIQPIAEVGLKLGPKVALGPTGEFEVAGSVGYFDHFPLIGEPGDANFSNTGYITLGKEMSVELQTGSRVSFSRSASDTMTSRGIWHNDQRGISIGASPGVGGAITLSGTASVEYLNSNVYDLLPNYLRSYHNRFINSVY